MYYIKDSKQSSRYHLHYTTSMAEIWLFLSQKLYVLCIKLKEKWQLIYMYSKFKTSVPVLHIFTRWLLVLFCGVFLGGGVQRNNCKLHLYITYLTTSITCTYKIYIIECIKIDIFIGESVIIRKLVAFKTVVRIKIHVYMYPFGDMRHKYFVTYWLSIIITQLITQHFNLTCILLILNCFLS